MAPYVDDITFSEINSRRLPAEGPAAGGDDLDDLFGFDAGLDDALRELTPPRVAPQSDGNKNKKRKSDILGLDEEVEVAKKIRAPKPKLDCDRLLSDAGIPELQKRSKKLRLKGKGHEYSNVAKLLEMYQIWLDDLFPKARFLDALAMVEKEGHKRRMVMSRNAWIDDGKPKATVEDDLFAPTTTAPADDQNSAPAKLAPIFDISTMERPSTPDIPDDLDDIYDATPRAAATAPVENAVASIFGPAKNSAQDEPEDDLDALLAEAEMEEQTKAVSAPRPAAAAEPDFDEEMEAMQAMEGMW